MLPCETPVSIAAGIDLTSCVAAIHCRPRGSWASGIELYEAGVEAGRRSRIVSVFVRLFLPGCIVFIELRLVFLPFPVDNIYRRELIAYNGFNRD